MRYVISQDGGWIENPGHGMLKRETRDETWEIDPAEPEGATGHLVFGAERRLDDWRAGSRAEIDIVCTAGSYRVEARLRADEGEAELFSKRWVFAIPRDHM